MRPGRDHSAGKLIDVKPVQYFTHGSDTFQTYQFDVQMPEQAMAVMRRIDGVQELSISEEGLLEVTTEREKVPAILEVLVQNQIRIYGVQKVRRSLEDQFLELTGGGQIG